MFIIRCILLFFLFFYGSTCFANTELCIKDIKLLGLQHISKMNIVRNFNINIKTMKSYKDIHDVVIKLYKTHFFDHIFVFKKNQNLIFMFKEKNMISDIIITGNKNFKKYVISNYLKWYGLQKYHIIDIRKLFKVKYIIQKLYNKFFIYDTVIKIYSKILKNHYVILKIKILEGTITSLKKVHIIGNKNISYDNISSFFNLSPSYFSKYTLYYKKYNFISLKKDLLNVRNFYYNNGYMYFFIKKLDFFTLNNKKNIFLNINISEGQQFFLSSIVIHNNFDNYKFFIQKEISDITFNKIYNFDQLLYIINKLKKVFLNFGFLECKIFFKPLISHINNKNVIVHFYIYPGKRFIVKNVYVQGNHLINILKLNHVIQEILPGSYVNLKKIEYIKNNIQKIQYVKNVQVQIVYFYNTFNAVDVIYHIFETNKSNLNINFGYSVFSGMNIYFKLNHEDWLGKKIKSIMYIIHNNYHNSIDLSYYYPCIIRNVFFSNHIFYNYIQNFVKNTLFYKNQNYGIEENIKFVISKYQNIQLTFGYIVNNITHENNQLILWNHIRSLENNINNFIFYHHMNGNIIMTYVWTYNNIPHIYFPTFGNKCIINIKFSLPVGDNNFHKEECDFEQYFTLCKNLQYIVHTRLHIGFENSFDHHMLPYYENFSFNEENNVRGFLNNSIGPKFIHVNDLKNIYSKNIPYNMIQSNYIGGNIFILNKIDFIIPNFFLLHYAYQNHFSTSLFLDYGNLWDTHWKNTIENIFLNVKNYNHPKNMYLSTGIQIKWISPIGPFVLSYAWPILYTNKDSLESLQFNINYNW